MSSPVIFLSHTTQDPRDYALAHRLADGLRGHGGTVWIAPESIPAGERWVEHVVSGIMNQCTHFLVILSSASTHAEWVLKEVALARQRSRHDAGFKLLPLIIGNLNDFKDRDFIKGLQAIPFHEDFATQLETVASAIGLPAGVPSRYVGTLLRTAGQDFIGRDYVFTAINEFLSGHASGYFTIQGDPGAGKSAILLEYVRRTNSIAHFNSRGQGVNTAQQFLESVCLQLITRFGLPYTSLPQGASRDGSFLTQLLEEASTTLRPNGRIVVVVDALDEVDLDLQPRGTNILFLPVNLPPSVYFVLTRRNVRLPFLTAANQLVFDLQEHSEETESDIQQYTRRALSSPGLTNWLHERSLGQDQVVAILAAKSQRNFMYLRYVLPALERGAYRDLSIDDLPAGLENYYEDHWRRMGMTLKPLQRLKIRIIYILSEIRQPVSRQLITAFSGSEELKADDITVQEALDEWSEFLHAQISPTGTLFSIYHDSFRDFLHRKDIIQAADITFDGIHALIADSLWKEVMPDD